MPPAAPPIADTNSNTSQTKEQERTASRRAAKRVAPNVPNQSTASRSPIMPIGQKKDERVNAPNGVAPQSVDVDHKNPSVTLVPDEPKQSSSRAPIHSENGIHQPNPAASHVLGGHPFKSQLPEPTDSVPADRASDQTPVEHNGHSHANQQLRTGQHTQPLANFQHQQHGAMMGLAAAFEGLSMGAPSHTLPGAHPGMVHHPHHPPPPPPHHPQHFPPHPPHGHAPPLAPGPPPAGMQPQHPAHSHPLMHSAPGGSQGLPLAHTPPPPPPPHVVAAVQASTMQMWVPQDRVGAVIGSQGAVIKALQDRSRATIQVHNDTIRGDRKLFTIMGGPAECQLARQLVTEIIERPRVGHSHSNSGGAAHQRSDRNPYSPPDGDRAGHMSKTIFVPTSCVGLVIGRRGETIRDLQHKSGASIFVTRDRDAEQGSRDRSVQISGTERAIESAQILVQQIVREAQLRRNGLGPSHPVQASTAAGVMAGPMLVETLTVPDDKVGLIIGKGGAAIRELQSMSGAKIQVAKEDEASSSNNTRPVTITGVRTCIDHAKTLIAEKVNMHLPPSTAMQTFSPQQPAFHPASQGLYYPMYEPGFGAHMQPPFQPMPHQGGFDPNDPQMRAAMAYYQYTYGFHAHHQQMQFHGQDAHRQHMQMIQQPESHDAAEQDGSSTHDLQQPTDSITAGETNQPQVDTVSPSLAPHQAVAAHPHAINAAFAVADATVSAAPGSAQAPNVALTQGMPLHLQQRRMMVPGHTAVGTAIHAHAHPQMNQGRVPHVQIQPHYQAAHLAHIRAAQIAQQNKNAASPTVVPSNSEVPNGDVVVPTNDSVPATENAPDQSH